MNLDDLLGIDPNDSLARRARRLVDADRRLVSDLVARRKELKLTQEEVARRMDTSQSVVARIESGVRDMHQSTLRRYAMAVEAVVEHAVVPDSRAHERSTKMIHDFVVDSHDVPGSVWVSSQRGRPLSDFWKAAVHVKRASAASSRHG